MPSIDAEPPAPVDGVVESYRRLADVFHDVLSEQSLDALLELIADTLTELIPHDALHIYEVDEAARELVPQLARSEWAEQIFSQRLPFGQGITGWAVEHREPVLSNRAHLDPRVRFVPGTPAEPEALIVVPLIARSRLRGTLNIYRAGEEAAFGDDEFQLAIRFGDAAALAIDNAHIRASLEHQAQTDALTGLYNHRAFHERLRDELLRQSAQQGAVGLVMLDLDDFKRVNDVYGHGVGDQVLRQVADMLRACLRQSDLVCRIGGEEFAVIVPADAQTTERLAKRIGRRIAETEFASAGRMSVSVGIAMGPDHAANPRELVACAEVAMMTAKARGKSRVETFRKGDAQRPDEPHGREHDRSIAHLKMLQTVSSRLARLNAVSEIGATIADELRQLIDYHNCRVFLREGDSLRPIAFRGQLTAADGADLELLATTVGQGVTGRVAETGEPLLISDAASCEFGRHIEGTAQIEESLLAVPLMFGTRVVGVIVVSQLGLDQFDGDDLRLMQVLAGHASSALVNAQLYEAQRREAESAKALLELSRELSTITELTEVVDRVTERAARILGAPHASLWLPASESGGLECRAAWSAEGRPRPVHRGLRLPASVSEPLSATEAPFLVDPHRYEGVLEPGRRIQYAVYAVGPVPLDSGWGAIAVASDRKAFFGARELELLGGIAGQAKLAIANAIGFATLEQTFLSTVEALANALEAKDESSSSHARWITDLAIRVGRELGVDPPTLKRIELAGLLHDIGKIGIPAEVLLKPGPLTADERRLIETHPELGERILEPIEQLRDVRPIVRACHERFDGSGYPDGLRGDAIPLEARIIFACNAFHAMTTDRPYRRALSVDEARRQLAAGADAQFDPAVVRACLRVLAST